MGHTCGGPNEIELTAAHGIVLPLRYQAFAVRPHVRRVQPPRKYKMGVPFA